MVLVDLLSFSDGTGKLYQPYRQALARVAADYGITMVWLGTLDDFLIGSSSPEFDEMTVLRAPGPKAWLFLLMDPEVQAARKSLMEGVDIHWQFSTVSDHTLEI